MSISSLCRKNVSLFSNDPIQEKLILAFRLFAMLKMDDLTYTHISARSQTETFYLNCLGPLFEEMTPDLLVELNISEQHKRPQNQKNANVTGARMHRAIYQKRPDVQAIVHLHTPEGVAVSALKGGLSYISQFSYHFVDNLATYPYRGLLLEEEESKSMAAYLGEKNAMLLCNHGLLTVGKTMEEAFFYMYYLHMACRVQLMTHGKEVMMPTMMQQQKAHKEMRAFEKDLGKRDWDALVRGYVRVSC